MSGARRWIGYVAMVIVFAVACGLLAWWQFARLEEAKARVDRIERNWDAAPVPLDALVSGSAPGTADLDVFDIEDTWHPVELTGEYLADEQLLVRNRPRDGQPGFAVIVPFRTDEGPIVIVDRGWLPVGSAQNEPDTVPAPPRGTVTVVVRLKPGEMEIPGRTAPEGQVGTIHLPTVAELVGGPVVTGAYGLLASEDPAPATAPAPPQKPAIDEGPHLSYALQWIVFGLMAFVAFGWALRRELRIRRGLDPDLRFRRRRPTDAEEEDALLDSAQR